MSLPGGEGCRLVMMAVWLGAAETLLGLIHGCLAQGARGQLKDQASGLDTFPWGSEQVGSNQLSLLLSPGPEVCAQQSLRESSLGSKQGLKHTCFCEEEQTPPHLLPHQKVGLFILKTDAFHQYSRYTARDKRKMSVFLIPNQIHESRADNSPKGSALISVKIA